MNEIVNQVHRFLMHKITVGPTPQDCTLMLALVIAAWFSLLRPGQAR